MVQAANPSQTSQTQSRVTSAEVAKRAGVSQSAVSRVFTPGASVSLRMADKVRKAADALGYRPNVLARAVASGRSNIIGLVVAYLDNHFYPEVIEKLSASLQARGYHLLIFMTSQTAGDIDTVVQEILDYQVDGIIFASVALSSTMVERCQAAGVPALLFNRSTDYAQVSAITSDNFEGGRKVAEFLLTQGYKDFGYIAGWEGASTQRDREAGFSFGLSATGAEISAREVGNFEMEEAKEAARRMFDASKDRRPDAVFVANDHMAFAVMDVLRFELGLSVPKDVAVVGYDDVPQADWPTYALTTVRQRSNLMVEQTVEALMKQITDPGSFAPLKLKIDGPLIVRQSAPDRQSFSQEKVA